MKRIEFKLKLHTPWCKFGNVQYEGEFDIKQIDEFMQLKHHYVCGDICTIDISNDSTILLLFKEDKTENEVRELAAIILYFISLCNGYNCEYYEWANIDGISSPHFFSFAKEDELAIKLYKNIKFYEISLEDIDNQFGEIIYNLFTVNRRYILMLLSNYYSTVVYKDFIGNGEYLFRNIITNIESIITAINKEDYEKIKQDNKIYLNNIAEKIGISNNKIGKYIMPKSKSLEEKLQDVIKLIENNFNLKFKLTIKNECKKIANTRNLVSHAFDSDVKCLSDKELSMYTSVFTELFRMLFLCHCKVEKSLIKDRFLNNAPIRKIFEQVFEYKP